VIVGLVNRCPLPIILVMTDIRVTYDRPPAVTGSFAVQVRGLRMSFGATEVLHGDFDVSYGEVFCLLGPNGAGKPVTDLRLSFVGGGTVAGSAGGWPWLASAAVPRRYRRDMA
jgi:ABC-type uncharacterized transport system ATPase subunit